MIIKSYELEKKIKDISNFNFFLFYGENVGLKKDIKNIIINKIKQKHDDIETVSFYESEIIDKEENFYNFIFSGSLFGSTKVAIISEASDKIIKKANDIFDKSFENVFLIFFSGVLEKKSKLRNIFEKKENTICIPCYLDSEKDLEIIARKELEKNNISISREAINLLIEKSNSDRDNLRNEIEKIKSYSFKKKKIEYEEIKSLINFSGSYKSDILINECLCGNISQYKKIVSELYLNSSNQILLLRILSNKVQRLLNIKSKEDNTDNLDNLMNLFRPQIFWKEKPVVKKQLSIWSLKDLKKVISAINRTELYCKQKPQISNAIFFDFFLKVCIKANSFS